jgi:hypothetical protein
VIQVKHTVDLEIRPAEIPADAPAAAIESTAQMLEGMNYEPVLLLKTRGFLRMGRNDLRAEIARVNAMSDAELMVEGPSDGADISEFKIRHIQLLIYHYALLCRLRKDDPSAWDTINELMEDD